MATKAVANTRNEAIALAARYKKQIAKMKAAGEKVGSRVMDTGLTIGGGALMGAINGKYPGKWMNIDKEIWIGAPMLLVGLTGIFGDKVSDGALSIANGVFALWAGNMVKSKLAA